MPKMFRDTKEFWKADPRREYSEEADYGVHWDLPGYRFRWRVSYIRATGEIYAVYLHGIPEGPLMLLGQVPPDPVENEYRDLYYRTLEGILDGWAQMCTRTGDLEWVRDRLQQAGYGTERTAG